MLPRIQQNNFARSNYENNIFNSDGQQFHQYQQSEQLPLTSTGIIENKKDHNILPWKPRAWIGAGTKKCRVKTVTEHSSSDNAMYRYNYAFFRYLK
jgi:hypothetical protein